ncbi:hypothetical protein NIES3974_40140 [Calothrix sp. NIES-3974]|nr:hypothetical protein NIES3974_40140 [Calothrix sp. NIES-3974]
MENHTKNYQIKFCNSDLAKDLLIIKLQIIYALLFYDKDKLYTNS